MSEYKAVETKEEGSEFWVRAARATREQWGKEAAANKTGEIDLKFSLHHLIYHC